MVSSTINPKSSSSVTPDKGHPRKNTVTMTSSPLQKYYIFPRKGNKTHVTKPQYEGTDHSRNKRSHGENDIQDNYHTERANGENTLKFTNNWNNRLTKIKRY